MCDMVFNELSIKPLARDKTEGFKRVIKFIETFKCGKQHGFNRIRFEDSFDQILLDPEYTLNNFCNEQRTHGTLLRGLARYPFIDDDSEEEKYYIENRFAIIKNGGRLQCYGLAAAYLYTTIGIGFASDAFWEGFEHLLEIQGNNKETATVYCVSTPDHFQNAVIEQWLESRRKIEIIKCPLSAHEKQISLREDHGKDILLQFSKKIVQSPYVIRIINSLPFNPSERKFIKRIRANGNIEIVLTDTDKGLGLVVKTTGRNIRETKLIAQILEGKYY